jgi:hypothetical protein
MTALIGKPLLLLTYSSSEAVCAWDNAWSPKHNNWGMTLKKPRAPYCAQGTSKHPPMGWPELYALGVRASVNTESAHNTAFLAAPRHTKPCQEAPLLPARAPSPRQRIRDGAHLQHTSVSSQNWSYKAFMSTPSSPTPSASSSGRQQSGEWQTACDSGSTTSEP